MNRIFNNLTHLEPGQMLILFPLCFLAYLLFFYFYYMYLGSKNGQAQLANSQRPQMNVKRFRKTVPKVKQQFTMEQPPESTAVPTQLPNPNSKPPKKRNSFSSEIYYKALGLFVLPIAAIIRYGFDIYPWEIKYAYRWQVHATMALIILGAWIYGATRKKPRGLWDVVVNVLLVVWAILFFN